MGARWLCLVVFWVLSQACASAESGPTLSQKPTFECERAQTSIARIICSDRSGPGADWALSAATWALRFSLDESSQDLFLQAHKEWFQSLYGACDLTLEQAMWFSQQRDCVLRAFHVRARLYQSRLSGDALLESKMSPEQRAQLQIALSVLGFLDDEADGEFGPLTRKAIRSFQEKNGFPQSNFLAERQRSALMAQAHAWHNGPITRTPERSAPNAPNEMRKREPVAVSSGSGFYVNSDGKFITKVHVVEGCSAVWVSPGNLASRPARVVAKDASNDLALLETGKGSTNVASFRTGVKLGEWVGVFGFPLHELLATSGNFTLGNVTATAGIRDDARMLQMSAPIQPGNSGGPVLDELGNVVGIVNARLKLASAAPQNINFAIKSAIITSFLDSHGVSFTQATGVSNPKLQPPEIAERAKSFSARVECRKEDPTYGQRQEDKAETRCRVADPTGTPLNARTSPNGTVVASLKNGVLVSILDRKSDAQGRPWALIAHHETGQGIGWVFQQFITCF
jgi:S1-C subfamily serine protease